MPAPTAARRTALLGRLELITACTFGVNNLALALKEWRYPDQFPRWLELTYLSAFVAMVALAIVIVRVRAGLRQAGVTDDERTHAMQRHAAFVALGTVLVLQLPFIIAVSVPAKVLGLLTATTGVLAYAFAKAWLDRDGAE